MPLDKPEEFAGNPVSNASAVTPSNTTNLPNVPYALYIGSEGNVSVEIGGSTVLFQSMQAGAIYPIRPTRVNTTGTTATGIIALY